MTVVYSITGVDGTGKSTLLKNIKDLGRSDIQTLYVPQYYQSHNSTEAKLSEILERIGRFADKIELPTLKANITYLQFCMFGKLITQLTQQDNCHYIITERYPVLDALAFAKFYIKVIDKNINEQQLKDLVSKEFTSEELELISQHFPDKSIYTLHHYLIEIMQLETFELIAVLQKDFESTLPKHLVQLVANEQVLKQRLALKQGAAEQAVEAHETVEVLKMMQDSFSGHANAVASRVNQFKFTTLDISTGNEHELLEKILKAFKLD